MSLIKCCTESNISQLSLETLYWLKYLYSFTISIIQKLTWAMKQSIGLSAPSLTVVFLFVFFMRYFSVTLSRNTWKGDFPAKYSCHPLTLEKSNQSNPWLCQLGGGLQLFECVHFQKYFIAHHFTVGFWILSNCCLFGWDPTLTMPLCSSGLRFRRNIYNHQCASIW